MPPPEPLEPLPALEREVRLPALLHVGEVEQHARDALAHLRAVARRVEGVVVRVVLLPGPVPQDVERLAVVAVDVGHVRDARLDALQRPARVARARQERAAARAYVLHVLAPLALAKG